MIKRQISLLISAGLGFSAVAASQTASRIEEVQVVASRIPSDPNLQTRDVQTIGAKELHRYTDLAAALSSMPGLHVQSPGGNSGFASLFLDGADPNFTVVLFDGVRLNNPMNTRGGAVNIATIETATLARAEVVRGSYSSIHGSGALAGAVNLLVPAGADTFTGRGEITAGENGFRSAFLRAQGPIAAGLGGSVSLSAADDGVGPGGSSFQSRAATLKVAPLTGPIGSTGSLLVRISKNDAKTFPDSSGGDQLAERRQLEQRSATESMVALRIPVQVSPRLSLSMGASWLDSDSGSNSPGVAPSITDPFGVPAGLDDTRLQRLLLQADSHLDLRFARLVFGMEHDRESGRSTGELDFFGFPLPSNFALSRNTTSAYAELSKMAANWALDVSSRFDKVEQLETKITAGAAARFDIPAANVSLRFSVGTGYKAPSLYALSNPFVGNGALKAESNTNLRASVTWTPGANSKVAVSAFQARYTNLIDFDPGPPPRLVNRATVRSRGGDVHFVHPVNASLQVTGFVEHAETINRATGEALLDRPKTRAGAGLNWQPTTSLSLASRFSYIGKRRSYSIPSNVLTLASYYDLSLNATWQLSQRYTLRLGVENFLDQEYQHAAGFSAQPQRIRLGISGEL